MTASKTRNNSSELNLPTIDRECGYKILLIPDLKAMGQAIEGHVLDHKKSLVCLKQKLRLLKML